MLKSHNEPAQTCTIACTLWLSTYIVVLAFPSCSKSYCCCIVKKGFLYFWYSVTISHLSWPFFSFYFFIFLYHFSTTSIIFLFTNLLYPSFYANLSISQWLLGFRFCESHMVTSNVMYKFCRKAIVIYEFINWYQGWFTIWNIYDQWVFYFISWKPHDFSETLCSRRKIWSFL